MEQNVNAPSRDMILELRHLVRGWDCLVREFLSRVYLVDGQQKKELAHLFGVRKEFLSRLLTDNLDEQRWLSLDILVEIEARVIARDDSPESIAKLRLLRISVEHDILVRALLKYIDLLLLADVQTASMLIEVYARVAVILDLQSIIKAQIRQTVSARVHN